MSAPDSFPKLNPLQLSALVILMAEAREVTNKELEELAGFTLTGKDRTQLDSLGLIESRKVDRVLAHQLTDKGWRMCKEFGTTTPITGSRPGRALLVLLAGVHQSLERLRISHGEFFKRSVESAPPAPVAVDATSEQRVRAAYDKLASRPGAVVALAALRAELTDLDRR